ncbi:XRE family transcriptional regulator [Paenibacillus glycanilyticus]|uniref:XRE family transcriptional regulator n=1 Tax=Paenibacillus glycanilyticus TaxID=126569 RepID=UPI000FD9E01C|nr:XRE family transcriptional regulator [Paenibacillus glycanilyticus]
MYPNLAAELARKGLKQKDLVPVLKTRAATISSKLNGKSPLLIDEAFKIQSALFPEMSLDYLFKKEEEQGTA